MPLTPFIAIAFLCLAMTMMAWLVLAGAGPVRRRAVANLNRGTEAEGSVGVTTNARRGGGFGRLVAGVTPRQLQGYLDRLLQASGRPPAWPLERVIAAKFVLLLAAGGVALLMGNALHTPLAYGLGLFVTALAFFIPDLRMYSQGIERRQAISLQLPDTLDQMSIAVQAGLGFDAAMIRVARNGKGVLAEELIRAMQDIQVGQPRRLAYSELGDRCGVPELRRFMRSIVQAETYGLAVSDVLQSQADEMRVARRQRAEQKAMQIPVKVVFPLILCILPVLFIVLLGPAGIRIAAAFGAMG